MSSSGSLVRARPMAAPFVARHGFVARGGMEAALSPETARWPAPVRLALILGAPAALWAAIFAVAFSG